MTNREIHLRRLIVSAIFLALALILRAYTSFYIPLFGYGGMRVGLHSMFSMMPAILFGPVYGGIISGLMDLLGFMIRPSGAYLPLMTVIAVAGGFLRGWLWLIFRQMGIWKGRVLIGGFSCLLVLFGIMCFMLLRQSGVDAGFYDGRDIGNGIDLDGMYFIARWAVQRTQIVSDPAGMLDTIITSVTLVPIAAGIFGGLLLGIDILLSKRLGSLSSENENSGGSIMPLLIAMLISGMFVNTLNTILLRETLITSWQQLPFVVVWLPRIVQSVIVTTAYVYGMSFLLGICKQYRFIGRLMR